MHLPDIIEVMENAAERWAEDNIWHNEETNALVFKCGCGKVTKLAEGQPSGPDPYAPPICLECFDKAVKET